MGDWYNITAVAGSQDFNQFAGRVDQFLIPQISLGIIIQIMIFVVFFLIIKNRGTDTLPSFTVAAFVTGMSTLILKPIGILPDYWWWVGLMLIPVAIFANFWSSSNI